MSSTSSSEDIKLVMSPEVPLVDMPANLVQLFLEYDPEVPLVALLSVFNFTPYVEHVVLNFGQPLSEQNKTKLLQNVDIKCDDSEIKLETLFASQGKPLSLEYYEFPIMDECSFQNPEILKSKFRKVLRECFTMKCIILLCNTLPQFVLVLDSLAEVLTPEEDCTDESPKLKQLTLVRGLEFEKMISFVPFSNDKCLRFFCMTNLSALLANVPDSDFDKTAVKSIGKILPSKAVSKIISVGNTYCRDIHETE